MGKKKTKPGVMLYWDMFDALQYLPDGQMRILLTAIRRFAQYKEEPYFDENDTLWNVIWPMIRQRLVEDDDRYERVRQRNQIGGLRRSFKLDYAPSHGIDPNDTEAMNLFIQQRLCPQMATTPYDSLPNTDTVTNTVTDTATETNTETETKTNSNTISMTATEPSLPFFPPTESQVRAFCQEKGLQMNARGFLDHYEKAGWKIGFVPVRDWKQEVINWAGETCQL